MKTLGGLCGAAFAVTDHPLSSRRIVMSFRRIMVLAVALAAASLLGIHPTAIAAEQDLSVNARLLLAARNADSVALARELKQGAAADARNRLGETALLIALKKNELGIANTMLVAGTDVNLAAVNGVTPLMAAAYAGQVEMVTALLARGANVNAVDRLKKNAMTYAAGEGHAEIVQMLLAKGVDPNAIYNNDLTALMWAAGSGKTATIKVLLAAGARTDLRDNRGLTALDMARDGKHDETAKVLASAGHG
jgi:hypothetical protein